jgi:hypothetical protein
MFVAVSDAVEGHQSCWLCVRDERDGNAVGGRPARRSAQRRPLLLHFDAVRRVARVISAIHQVANVTLRDPRDGAFPPQTAQRVSAASVSPK